jgi:hypothetical protein
MDYQGYITIEPGRRSGKPCIRGLRITVYEVLDYLGSGMTEDEIRDRGPAAAYADRENSCPRKGASQQDPQRRVSSRSIRRKEKDS